MKIDYYSDINNINDINDINIIYSRNYNRINKFINKPLCIYGFDNKPYKISSQIPKLQDTMSYYIMKKSYDFSYNKDISIDTMDLMLIRQNIDKKQRYELVNNSNLKYGIYTLISRRFTI